MPSGSVAIGSVTMVTGAHDLDLRLDARDRLDRLVAHYRWSLVVLVEELAASAERAVEAKLSGKALEAYRDAGYEARPRDGLRFRSSCRFFTDRKQAMARQTETPWQTRASWRYGKARWQLRATARIGAEMLDRLVDHGLLPFEATGRGRRIRIAPT